MKRDLTPIYFDGNMTAERLRAILGPAGYVVTSDGAGRLVATEPPAFLVRGADERQASIPFPEPKRAAVVPLRRKAR